MEQCDGLPLRLRPRLVSNPRGMRRMAQASLAAVALLPALLAVSLPALAQFPQKPVRIIVPFGAGGPTDIVARLLSQGLAEAWKQPVLVESRPGGGGNIGTEMVVRSAPDGHTLVINPAGPLVINRWLFDKMPFDAQKDLAPVSLLASTPLVMFVTPNLPVNNLAELFRHAKENPGKLNFGSAGIGTMPHLAGEMLKSQAQVNIIHIAYKSAPLAVAAAISGEVQFTFDSPVTLSQARAGKLRAIAVTGSARHAAAPELPTFAEAGLKDFAAAAWYGLLAPAGTPRDIINTIHAEAAKILLAPDARAKLAGIGFESVAGGPEALAALIVAESARWGGVIKAAGIRLE